MQKLMQCVVVGVLFSILLIALTFGLYYAGVPPIVASVIMIAVTLAFTQFGLKPTMRRIFGE
jgi:hypothetical protein